MFTITPLFKFCLGTSLSTYGDAILNHQIYIPAKVILVPNTHDYLFSSCQYFCLYCMPFSKLYWLLLLCRFIEGTVPVECPWRQSVFTPLGYTGWDNNVALLWTWWKDGEMTTCAIICVIDTDFNYLARMCRNKKVIVFVIVVVVVHKKSWDLHVGTWVTHEYNESIEVGENWLQYASNRVALSTSVTNSVFLLVIIATPIDCTMHTRTMYILSAHAHNLVYL